MKIFPPSVTKLNPPERFLMGPGPSDVDPRVLEAMGRPLVGHLDPAFLAMMDDVQQMLRYVFQTENTVTFPISATGMAGMEACFVNTVEPGDRVLVFKKGVFGLRMAEIARRAGGVVTVVEKPMGQVFGLDDLESALAEHKPQVVAVVHGETSTGVLQPLQGWGDACHHAGALLLVDCVTSLAGVPVAIDEWGIDVAYSGTQKCLSAPPGLSPVTFSERSLHRLKQRQNPVQSWYLDVSLVEPYWRGGAGKRAYHHTAPISMIYALHEALRIVCEETLPVRWQRHQDVHVYLKDALSRRRMSYAADERHLLYPLNAVRLPDGWDDQTVRSQLLAQHRIEIGGGLGDFAGSVWRIGCMGFGAQKSSVDRLISAFDEIGVRG